MAKANVLNGSSLREIAETPMCTIKNATTTSCASSAPIIPDFPRKIAETMTQISPNAKEGSKEPRNNFFSADELLDGIFYLSD